MTDKNEGATPATPYTTGDGKKAHRPSPRQLAFVDSLAAGIVSGLVVAIAIWAGQGGINALIEGSPTWQTAVFGFFLLVVIIALGFVVHQLWGQPDQYRAVIAISLVLLAIAILLTVGLVYSLLP